MDKISREKRNCRDRHILTEGHDRTQKRSDTVHTRVTKIVVHRKHTKEKTNRRRKRETWTIELYVDLLEDFGILSNLGVRFNINFLQLLERKLTQISTEQS